jgi:hypothetical protein
MVAGSLRRFQMIDLAERFVADWIEITLRRLPCDVTTRT